MRKALLLLLAIAGIWVHAFAQKTTVSGKVTDQNGQPVPFASITEKGTRNGTVSDEAGSFTMSVAPGAKLVVSAAGFKVFEIAADATVSVKLTSVDKEMSEVVVTALGVRKEKKALGYSVQEVKGENLTIAKSQDVSSSLVGKVAGVQIVGSPSSTFDNADILIRGLTGLGP